MRHISIYGGSHGIGAAIVKELLAEFPTPVIHVYDRSATRQPNILFHKWEFGGGPDFAPITTGAGPIDEIYITIGRPSGRSFEATDPVTEREIMDGNFHSVTSALRHAAVLASETASFVLTSSVSASLSDPGGAVYAAGKAAVEALARGLAREWIPQRVNVVAPGPTSTAQFLRNVPIEVQIAETERNVWGRLCKPEEIAKAMIQVARLEAVTGQVLTVDYGGTVASRRD